MRMLRTMRVNRFSLVIAILLFSSIGFSFTASDIRGYYRFDSATGDAVNSMGTGMDNLHENGTVAGITGRNELYKRGVYNESNFFESTTESLWNTSQNYSINLWFQFNSTWDNSYQTLAGWGRSGTGLGGDLLLYAGQLYCRMFTDGVFGGQTSAGVGNSVAGVWHMATYMFNGTHITCIIDNSSFGTEAYSGGNAAKATQVAVGSAGSGIGSPATLEHIEQVLFFNKILDSDELASLYNSGTGTNMNEWAWWNVSFNWRYNFNLSISLINYTGTNIQVRIAMNTSNMFASSSCQDTISCNDSIVTWLNGSIEQQIYYWWENYSDSSATLWIKAPILNTTDNVFYLYYNSTLVSRSGYYSGMDTFIRFNDFENYTNGSRPSADFDGYSTPANLSQLYVTNSGCLRGDRCLYFNMADTKGVTYGLLSNQFSSGILEFFYKVTGTQSDASAYWGTGINGTPEGMQPVTGSGSIVLQTDWTFVRWQWNGTGSLGNFTETGNNHEMQLSAGQNFTQQVFPFHIASTQPFYSDNYILRAYMPHDAVIRTMSGIIGLISPNVTDFKSNYTNQSSYQLGKIYQFNITIKDDNEISMVWIRHNFTSTFTNYTVSTNVSSEYYYDYGELSAGHYQLQWWANDSSGNLNSSDLITWNVNKTTLPLSLYINGANADVNVLNNTIANFTANLSSGAFELKLWTNLTGTMALWDTQNSPLTNLTNLSPYPQSNYSILVNWTGNENYTYVEASHTLKLNQSQHITNLTLFMPSVGTRNEIITISVVVKDTENVTADDNVTTGFVNVTYQTPYTGREKALAYNSTLKKWVTTVPLDDLGSWTFVVKFSNSSDYYDSNATAYLTVSTGSPGTGGQESSSPAAPARKSVV